MKNSSCKAIRSTFSDYLDGALSGLQMQQIARHIEGYEDDRSERIAGCTACARELAAWRTAQEALSALGPLKAPADLSRRLRLAIAQEREQSNWHLLDRLSLAWENSVHPLLLRATAGFAGSVALVGSVTLLLGVVAAPQAVLANDEPLGAITAPHYLYSTTTAETVATEYDSAVVVEASIDSSGRVYDYTIVAGPQDQAVRSQVVNQLLGSVYQPASAFGVPIRGRVVITFAGISVYG
ncbi:MAG: anti-sigma factor [Acidobacteriaceae bacterium]|nr:anti-sigma factor [Acidobacteriaceae bacterium]